ncbi:uncharacterized protein N7482_010585 [Penicillium canariense]|uniref:Zn(2)-C6 fungal-type domain-containing protein n=1 Tax=Penicillium canariense TaxID=189055 RepID=A0A9W9HMA0_9EURO|nr:uncharacterized protein N7482_010585 [Penicillium canariense]KAJ5151333.1 hypothetical protein N7482_010585 [Penicillium canariense]
MQPAFNYRQSRRSACDRCRGFKLRCQRGQVGGKTCERCLKAQVVCTTSIGHPAPNFPHSKANSANIAIECDEGMLKSDRVSMPILHGSVHSKIRKLVPPSGIPRRHDRQSFNSWRRLGHFPSFDSGGTGPTAEEFDLSISSGSPLSITPEHWRNSSPAWNVNYQLPQGDLSFLEPENRLRNQPSCSEALITNHLPSFQIHSSANKQLSSIPGALDLADPEYLLGEEMDWNSPWRPGAGLTEDNGSQITSLGDWTSTGAYGIQRKLLQLNLEVMGDLELLEVESDTVASNFHLGGSVYPTVSKLDIPIFRMLNHSTKLLEILDCENTLYASFSSPLEAVETYSYIGDDGKSPLPFVTDNIVEDGVGIVSSDSGYWTMMIPPQNPVKASSPKNEMPVFLSLLTTYSHLIQLYHDVFALLYRSLLIISPDDDTSFLLFPSLHFRQSPLEGNLRAQIEVLIELSSSMLGNLDRALRLTFRSVPQSGEQSGSMAYLSEITPLVAIPDQIISQENKLRGISLEEIMSCLSHLVKERTNV